MTRARFDALANAIPISPKSETKLLDLVILIIELKSLPVSSAGAAIRQSKRWRSSMSSAGRADDEVVWKAELLALQKRVAGTRGRDSVELGGIRTCGRYEFPQFDYAMKRRLTWPRVAAGLRRL